MDVGLIAAVIAGGGALDVVVWVLATLGKALITIADPVGFADLPPGAYRDVSLRQLRTWAPSGSDTEQGGAA